MNCDQCGDQADSLTYVGRGRNFCRKCYPEIPHGVRRLTIFRGDNLAPWLRPDNGVPFGRYMYFNKLNIIREQFKKQHTALKQKDAIIEQLRERLERAKRSGG